jgi:hypothetical protein
VGIGTITPTTKLNVVGSTDLFGNLRVGGSSSSTAFNIDLGTSGTGGNYRAGYLYGDGTTIYLTNQQVGGLNFGTNNTGDRMVITAAGNVGIGTASPGSKLDVNGNSDIFGTLRVGASSSSPNFIINLGTSGTGGNYRAAYLYGDGTNIEFNNQQNGAISFSTNNTPNRFTIYADGNVGIGTNSPVGRLTVIDSTNSPDDDGGALFVTASDTTNKRLHMGYHATGNYGWIEAVQKGVNLTNLALQSRGGRVTIGGSDGSYPLTVFRASNSGNVGGYAGWSGNYGWQNQTTSYDVSIYSQYFMMSGQGFLSVSDQRIKKDIVDIEDGESLNILRQIQPKRYRYIDEYKRGTDYVYGFIAQQVRQVLPSASGLVKDVIPNIITSATVSYDSENDITTVTLVDNKQHNLTSENSNSRVRFFDENDVHTDLEIHEIVSGNIFKVKGELKGTNTFVYGIEVEDFHTLNKDAIFTVALAALQQVDRELQETKQTVNDLVQRIQALENAN